MNFKLKTFLLIGVVLVSVFATNNFFVFRGEKKVFGFLNSGRVKAEKTDLSGEGLKRDVLASLETATNLKKEPMRNWKVLDPELSAKAAIVQSLDDYFPFYHANI